MRVAGAAACWLKYPAQSAPRFWEDPAWNLDNHPVVGVSWFEALAYAEWLNAHWAELAPTDAPAGWRIRLPAEAEWEYAARGPKGWRYAWGDDADPKLGNSAETGLGRTSAVGVFPPGQAFGLYDMSGNVWEWTLSRWGRQFGSPGFTYKRWEEQESSRNLVEPVEFRIIRGGSWDFDAGVARCAIRLRLPPGNRLNYVGFRLLAAGFLPG